MTHDSDPLSGPTDDVPEPEKPSTEIPKKTENDDGSEWIPVPGPAEGDGPLP
ncbi:hypothetical protein GCM10025867_05370 [Frondihabitans sucicola]|uniref:Uncharacterized protein n=1 Tax=Frondihabitans sucicola TaxID=1268041 RepID=A0ABM8GIT7_9MICO|nr:hypothetical protein [Frondihabitans sucicola]BDZ48296.1 hypothetical protein GCM10025867_05370 [Frondihabitans sucicola]